MLIQEEYAQRHNLPVNLIGYTLGNAVVFLRCKGLRWSMKSGQRSVLLNLTWIPHERHPGSYQLQFLMPVHNSCSNRRMHFSPLRDDYTFQYEDLEGVLKGLRKDLSVKAVPTGVESFLIAWEMFVCCHDNWLYRSKSTRMLENLECSIDPAFSLEDRMGHAKIALFVMSRENPDVYDTWNMHFDSLIGKASPWLARVINGE